MSKHKTKKQDYDSCQFGMFVGKKRIWNIVAKLDDIFLSVDGNEVNVNIQRIERMEG